MITIPLEEYKRKKREKLKRNIATIIRNHTIESSKHYIPSRETAEKILKLIEEER